MMQLVSDKLSWPGDDNVSTAPNMLQRITG